MNVIKSPYVHGVIAKLSGITSAYSAPVCDCVHRNVCPGLSLAFSNKMLRDIESVAPTTAMRAATLREAQLIANNLT